MARKLSLPVDDGVRSWHASPRAAVGFLIHAAGLDSKALGPRVNLTMPGFCCTVAEQIAALRRVAGDKIVSRIRHAPDPLIMRIVAGWPKPLRHPARATRSAFRPSHHSMKSFAPTSTTSWAAGSQLDVGSEGSSPRA